MIGIIPEQFPVKAHPALFEGKPKKVALLWYSQFTIHIHIQNAQIYCYSSLQFTYTFKTLKAIWLCYVRYGYVM